MSENLSPIGALRVDGHGLSTEVLPPVEMPDHRDLPQHHPAVWHGEPIRSSEQVWAASGPGEVTVLHPDGRLGKHGDHGLPVSGLQQIHIVSLHYRTELCCRKHKLNKQTTTCIKTTRRREVSWDSQVFPSQAPPGCRSHRCRWSRLNLHPASCLPAPPSPWKPDRPAQSRPSADQAGCASRLHRGTSRQRRGSPSALMVDLQNNKEMINC